MPQLGADTELFVLSTHTDKLTVSAKHDSATRGAHANHARKSRVAHTSGNKPVVAIFKIFKYSNM